MPEVRPSAAAASEAPRIGSDPAKVRHTPRCIGRGPGRGKRMVVVVFLVSLAVLAAAFVAVLVSVARRRGQLRTNAEAIALGAVTNFFDTLGIGSFAPTTAWLKLRRLIPDSFLPATLNSGHALPTIAQALIFINLVRVDPILLATCIAAAVLGATLGAPLVV